MRKIFILVLTLITNISFANSMFCEGCENNITLYISKGTGSGTLFKLIEPNLWEDEQMILFMGQYSQPRTFFRLPARQSLHIVQNVAWNNRKNLSFGGVGISMDVALIDYNKFYLGLGMGPYMRDSRDAWVESRLVFGEKFFIGKKISKNIHLELFTIHFSNGNFTQKNEGFNFAGLSFGYSF